MRLLFLFTTVICGLLYGNSSKTLYLNEGDVCKNGPDPWICKRINKCSTLQKAIDNKIYPDLCSRKPRMIYCCFSEKYISSILTTEVSVPPTSVDKEVKRKIKNPSTSSAISKADKMCEEYSKHACQIVNYSLQIKKKPTKICNIGMEAAIVGGVDAKPEEFPHMAIIGYEDRRRIGFHWICGGSLISPKFVLSAAHCTIQNSPSSYWVKLGDLDTSSEKEKKTVNIRVLKIITYPEYNSTLLYHDIALLELESVAKLSIYVRPLCLHTKRKIKNHVLATGWGLTSYRGKKSERLQKVTLSPVSYKECNKTFTEESEKNKHLIPKGIIDDLMFCAKGKGYRATCVGDSGGPLQIKHGKLDNMYSIVGIVSHGKGCSFFPSIYTRVSKYVPWIVEIVWP